jgi:hypothetical protein
MLRELKTDPRFYLFGSRSKGFEIASSDWDFSAADVPANRKFLEALGLYSSDGEYAYDDLTTTIYIGVDDGVCIHVVLHSNETLFRRAWEAITPDCYEHCISKRSVQFISQQKNERKRLIRERMNTAYAMVRINNTREIGYLS